jgi:hypothetical protein
MYYNKALKLIFNRRILMSHKSFISEKQVTQFIVNSYDFKNKEVHKLGFGGGSSLYLLREKT